MSFNGHGAGSQPPGPTFDRGFSLDHITLLIQIRESLHQLIARPGFH